MGTRLRVQVNLDMTDSMGPGKLVRLKMTVLNLTKLGPWEAGSIVRNIAKVSYLIQFISCMLQHLSLYLDNQGISFIHNKIFRESIHMELRQGKSWL